MADVFYNNSDEEEEAPLSGFNINGIPMIGRIPVEVEMPFQYGYDVERFIMSLPEDEARVLVVRALGFEGKAAAELAGFKSIWVYIRKLRKLQARAASSMEVAFTV